MIERQEAVCGRRGDAEVPDDSAASPIGHQERFHGKVLTKASRRGDTLVASLPGCRATGVSLLLAHSSFYEFEPSTQGLRSTTNHWGFALTVKVTIVIFICSAIALPQSRSECDEVEPYAALRDVVDLSFDYEFEKLAERMHPDALEHFRKMMGDSFERLLEKREKPEVLDALGLARSPADSQLSDKALFVALMTRAKELNPVFVGPASMLPIDVHGTVSGVDGRAFVVYEYTGAYSSKTTGVEYLRPRTLTFKKVGDRWLLYSTCFARSVSRVWIEKLLERGPTESRGG